MTVRQRGSGFQADVMLGGRRIRETFATAAEAEAYELQCRAADKLGQPLPVAKAGSSTTRAATIQGLYEYCAEHHWRGTKSESMACLNARQFVAYVGPKAAVRDTLTPAVVDAYVQWRMAEKRNSNATVNRHLAAVSILIQNAVRLGHLTAPFELRWKAEPKGRLRYYSEEEESQVIACLFTWGRPVDAYLVTFLADTGCRLGEALKLQWRDIDGRTISLIDTKNGTNRHIVATERVMAVLGQLRNTRGDKSGPFAGLSARNLAKRYKKVVSHLALEGGPTLHTWRHTCASRLAQRGVDLYHLQRWMGHTNPATTQRYAHLSPTTMASLAQVLEGQRLTVQGGHGGTVDAAALEAVA